MALREARFHRMRMLLKSRQIGATWYFAQEVIGAKKILWDAKETTIAHAFLTIRKIMTPGGQISYAANRTNTTGHADVAWAISRSLWANAPLYH